jgi:hypothetical protein
MCTTSGAASRLSTLLPTLCPVHGGDYEDHHARPFQHPLVTWATSVVRQAPRGDVVHRLKHTALYLPVCISMKSAVRFPDYDVVNPRQFTRPDIRQDTRIFGSSLVWALKSILVAPIATSPLTATSPQLLELCLYQQRPAASTNKRASHTL